MNPFDTSFINGNRAQRRNHGKIRCHRFHGKRKFTKDSSRRQMYGRYFID